MAKEEPKTYGDIDFDFVSEERERDKQEAAERAARDGIIGKLPGGQSIFRFLPPFIGCKSPIVSIFVHYVRAPGEEKGKPVRCNLKNDGQPCAACAEVKHLRSTGAEADKKLADDMAASRKNYSCVVKMDEPDKGVRLFEYGTAIKKDLQAYLDKKNVAFNDFTHPDTGCCIVIERTGTTFETTRYKVYPMKSTPIANREWLKQLKDPRLARPALPAARVRALLEGQDPDLAFPPGAVDVSDDMDVLPPGAK